MKRGICLILLIAMFCFLNGCGTDTDSERAGVEKDRIEKVGDAASSIGYDGDAIEKGLREIDDLSKDRDKAAEEILNE